MNPAFIQRNRRLLSLALALARLALAADAPEKSPDGILVFDAETKQMTVQAGEPAAYFTFSVANISEAAVTINAATASCGCTVAKLPAQPWVLAPGAHGEISVTMDVTGKSGEIAKFVYVSTTRGLKMLEVKTTVAANGPSDDELNREARRKIATADRQAVFQGDCANCHVVPARGKSGRELYAAACGICHDAERRATMVPDLRALPSAPGPEFWRNAIVHGKPGTLMPAFAAAEGGFFSDAQIDSLVAYLRATIPVQPAR